MRVPRPPLWVLTGPTATGKTAVAVEIARILSDPLSPRHLPPGTINAVQMPTSSQPQQSRKVEAISADSAAVFRHLRAGTARPTAEQLEVLPHAMLDVIDPREPGTVVQPVEQQVVPQLGSDMGNRENSYTSNHQVVRPSAAWFASEAARHAKEITERGHIPLVVGGSAFYLHFLLRGSGDRAFRDTVGPVEGQDWMDGCNRSDIDNDKMAIEGSRLAPDTHLQATGATSTRMRAPAANRSRMLQLEKWARETASRESWDVVVERLADVDPIAARNIQRNDFYRAARALDVYATTGKPYSSFGAVANDGETRLPFAALPAGALLRHFDVRVVTLSRPRTELVADINARCEEMLVSDGLLAEVVRLRHEGLLVPGTFASRLIGYAQSMEFLCRGEYDINSFFNFIEAFLGASRRLAKNQVTWFRQDRLFHDVVEIPSGLSGEDFAAEVLWRFESSYQEAEERRRLPDPWPEVRLAEKRAILKEHTRVDTSRASVSKWEKVLHDAGLRP